MIHIIGKEEISKLLNFEKNIRITEADIWCEAFDESTFLQKMKTYDHNDHYKIFAYEVEGKMVARCDVVLYDSRLNFEKNAFVDWIYVDIDYRKKGIGKKLLNHVIEACSADHLFLFTAQNKEAQSFYQHSKLTLTEKEVATYTKV